VAASVLFPDDGADITQLRAVLDARLAAAVAAAGANDNDGADGADGDPDRRRWLVHPPGTAGSGERRRPGGTRIRMLRRGRIILSDVQSTIECSIRNLSEGGAGLRLLGPAVIPEFFRLRIFDTGEVRNVRKCWQVKHDLGVEFLPD
jgi:two-component system cell cycle response regulator